MYWASNKSAYLLALTVLLSSLAAAGPAAAETGVVSAVGSGRDSPEAIISLLRAVVAKYFHDESPALTKAVLQSEILPNASSFVQSYKILEGGHGTAVSLSANVDLDVIRALISLTPENLGEASGAKALVVVKGARLPEGTQAKPGMAEIDPYSAVEAAARERLARRQFDLVRLSADEQKAIGPGEDVAAVELLRGLGARAGARVALGASSRYEMFENENSHRKEQRIVITATLVDVKAGTILGKSSAMIGEPNSRRDQYAADLHRTLTEDSKDLLHEVFVAAGKRMFKAPAQGDFSLVRVQQAGSALLTGKFRALLETIKGVKTVVEYSATRGAFDFALKPAQKGDALVKEIKALASDEIVITVVDKPAVAPTGAEKAPDAVVTLAVKQIAPPGEEEVRVEKP